MVNRKLVGWVLDFVALLLTIDGNFSRTKQMMSKKPVSVLFAVSILALAVVCGLCLGIDNSHHSKAGADCILFKLASTTSPDHLASKALPMAPLALGFLFSFALLLPKAGPFNLAESPFPLKVLPTNRFLAQLQTLLL
jgi:hypothetical protein